MNEKAAKSLRRSAARVANRLGNQAIRAHAVRFGREAYARANHRERGRLRRAWENAR